MRIRTHQHATHVYAAGALGGAAISAGQAAGQVFVGKAGVFHGDIDPPLAESPPRVERKEVQRHRLDKYFRQLEGATRRRERYRAAALVRIDLAANAAKARQRAVRLRGQAGKLRLRHIRLARPPLTLPGEGRLFQFSCRRGPRQATAHRGIEWQELRELRQGCQIEIRQVQRGMARPARRRGLHEADLRRPELYSTGRRKSE